MSLSICCMCRLKPEPQLVIVVQVVVLLMSLRMHAPRMQAAHGRLGQMWFLQVVATLKTDVVLAAARLHAWVGTLMVATIFWNLLAVPWVMSRAVRIPQVVTEVAQLIALHV